LGEIQFRRGNFEDAAKAFGSASDLNPYDARAVWGLGRVEEVRFQREHARELFAKAYQLDPHDSDILLSYLDGVADPSIRPGLLRKVAALSRVGDPDKASLAVAKLEIDQHLAGRLPARLASGHTTYRVPLAGFRPTGVTQDGLIVAVRINGSKPLRLVLDTGARGILVDGRSARNLGLESIVTSRVTGFETHTSSESVLALARSLAIGDLRFEDCLIEVSGQGIAGADGILGTELFEAFRMRIDARRQTMDLTPVTGNGPVAANAIGLRNLMLVKTAAAGKEGWFLLDTGAAYSTLARELVPAVMAKGAVNLFGVGGSLRGAYRLGPLSLGVEGRTLVDMAPVALDLEPLSRREGVEISGVLGYSALSGRPLTVDLRHGVISFD
jgi:tetratricopeptide (TPR) repeat protein